MFPFRGVAINGGTRGTSHVAFDGGRGWKKTPKTDFFGDSRRTKRRSGCKHRGSKEYQKGGNMLEATPQVCLDPGPQAEVKVEMTKKVKILTSNISSSSVSKHTKMVSDDVKQAQLQ